jgi:hypothetical protein
LDLEKLLVSVALQPADSHGGTTEPLITSTNVISPLFNYRCPTGSVPPQDLTDPPAQVTESSAHLCTYSTIKFPPLTAYLVKFYDLGSRAGGISFTVIPPNGTVK